jgi:hypothetical protein
MHEDPVVHGEAASPPRIQQLDPLMAQQPPSAEQSEHLVSKELLGRCLIHIRQLADLVSTVIRQTLRQMLTPDTLRGRMTSVNMIFFMGGPQLGEMEAGLVASLFASVAVGATVSVVSGGLATVLLAAAVGLAAPVVRDYVQPTAPPGA